MRARARVCVWISGKEISSTQNIRNGVRKDLELHSMLGRENIDIR